MAKRPIVRLPRGKDGLFIEPDAPDWVMISHNQERATKHYNYADEFTGDGNTFDPMGDYNCGRCNQQNDGKCLLLDIARINPVAGSCEDWESVRAGDPELEMNRKDPDVANYGVAKNGVGFGCHRCPYAKHAKNTDSQGRDHWCGELAFYIQPTGCCTNNGAPIAKDADKPTGFYDKAKMRAPRIAKEYV